MSRRRVPRTLRDRAVRRRNISRVIEYLAGKKCADCPERDPVVLDFDHTHPERKRKSVSQMVYGNYSWKAIQEEIAKCVIRCCNCHRRRHYRFNLRFPR